MVGAAELVLSRCAPGRGGSLAARGHVAYGARRKCCVRGWGIRNAGCYGIRWDATRRAVHAIGQYRPSLVGWSGAARGGERAGATGGYRGDPGAGHGWAVGQAERAGRAGGADGRRQRQWVDLPPGGGAERGACERMGRICWNVPKPRGWTCRSCAGSVRMGPPGCWRILRSELAWVQQQRCVWHIWRSLSGDLGRAVSQAVKGVSAEAVEAARKTVRAELGQADPGRDRCPGCGSRRKRPAAALGPSARPGAGPTPERLDGSPVRLPDGLLSGRAAGIPGVVLARLSLAAQPWAQPSLRAASGTGGVAVGGLPQLRARSMAIGTPPALSASWQECAASRRGASRTSQLSGCCGRLNAHSTAAHGSVSAVGGAGAGWLGDRPAKATNKAPNSPT